MAKKKTEDKELWPNGIPYTARVAPAMNGIIVSIGCKLFVGMPQDLDMLHDYYNCDTPNNADTRKMMPKRGAYMNSDDRPEAVACEDMLAEGEPMTVGLPDFMTNNPQMKYDLYKASNGWVICDNQQRAWIARSPGELVRIIGLIEHGA